MVEFITFFIVTIVACIAVEEGYHRFLCGYRKRDKAVGLIIVIVSVMVIYITAWLYLGEQQLYLGEQQ